MQISYLDGDPDSLGKKTWTPSPKNKSQIQFEVLRSQWSLQRREGPCLIELWPGLQESSSKGTCCLRLNYADGLITSNSWKSRKLLTQSHGALCGKLLHQPLWEWPRHAEMLWWQEAMVKDLVIHSLPSLMRQKITSEWQARVRSQQAVQSPQLPLLCVFVWSELTPSLWTLTAQNHRSMGYSNATVYFLICGFLTGLRTLRLRSYG